MGGFYIYKTESNQYYSFVCFDNELYNSQVKEAPTTGNTILWKTGNVSLQQMENARKTKDALVAKLNAGEKVDLKKELDDFFK
jgi:hypothetical protein